MLGRRFWTTWVCLLLGVRLCATQVTFQLDASNLPALSDSGMHMVGPFNNWNPGIDSLTPLGNGRFSRTFTFAPGSTLLYKYVNGNAWGGEEAVFGSCSFNTYRVLYVPATDTVLAWVCFDACDSTCTQPGGNRVACVGNSITWGTNLPAPVLQSYPSQLQGLLGPGYVVTNLGAPGAAVIRLAGFPYTVTEQFRAGMRYDPGTVLLMLGTNDSKSAIWGPYGSTFAQYYDSLCLAFDTLASQPRMVLCLPAKAFSGLFGVDDQVLAQSIVPAIARQARLRAWDQVDIRCLTEPLGANFPDGLHPDSLVSARIAQVIAGFLQTPRPTILGTSVLSSNPPGFGWQWYLNGDTLPDSLGGKAQYLLANQVGEYRVAVQMDSLCKNILVSDPLQLMVASEGAQSMEWSVYPNPTRDSFHWSCIPATGKLVTLRLWDAMGQLRVKQAQMGPSGTVQTNNLQGGSYVLEMMWEGGRKVARLNVF